ncbi:MULTISPECIES: hypothetical protein [unclassified Coleofasciculus]|uniref:hypothetical protein n=1 Tax=Cyanophyceae TaxID=3028117 RepID=UPI001689CB66|nr:MULTISPECIES: hypothetical protein [unclassified Coleofasciculus]MBD1881851.1 hypothetical protein [Coleofasciculus sp. FACHB-T130]MBD1897619.1 hypothetical protein [Coleofasciculus sp. FACHB-129]MBD1899395.1 hypothetical protein [Coleofasciculus sp. FACHB-125]MBD1942789.1 hypothetical protein [Coleofasciculus sp. FACHB-712]
MNILNKLSAATFTATLVAFATAASAAEEAIIPVTQANKPLTPVLEGVVSCPTGPYIAYFGYKNENSATVDNPVGVYNKFTPSPENRGQTTSFLSGRVYNAFSVKFDGGNLVWTLAIPGKRRTATASSTNATPLDVCPL